MNAKTKLISLAIAGVVSTAPMLTMATETESNSSEQTTVVEAVDQSVIKTVNEAFSGMREIHSARLAIFNGDIDSAAKFVSEAEKNFSLAEESVSEYQIKTKKSNDKTDAFIPFDMKIELSEGFVPTEDKHAHILKANEHLKNGEQSEAVQVLRLANIEVTVSAAMLPAQSSIKHVKDAVKLISEDKFYEANLALKAVEDSVILDFYDIDAIPVQGNQS